MFTSAPDSLRCVLLATRYILPYNCMFHSAEQMMGVQKERGVGRVGVEGFAFPLAVSAALLSDSCPTLYSASSPQTHRHRIAHNLQRTSRFITHASPQAGGAHINSHTVTHTHTHMRAHSWKTFSFFGWHSAISIEGRAGRRYSDTF